MLSLKRCLGSRGRLTSLVKAFSSDFDPTEYASICQRNPLQRFIRDKILSGGPISVHDYMQMCISSVAGYYSHQIKEFGEDFITAPELCPVFSEMLALWLYNEFLNAGYTGPIRLVELGPGTGLLIKNVLAVFSKLKVEQVSVHLVDVSDALKSKQKENIECSMDDSGGTVSKTGYHVQWHRSLDEIPSDALPIHQFRRNSDNRWREVYVNLDKNAQNFCFMLSKSENIHTKTLLPDHIRSDAERVSWEVCPMAFHILGKIADRFTSHGGFALIVDYGHDGSRLTPSLRAYKNHGQVDVLEEPGVVDLTADVDFGHLKRLLADKCLVFGPVQQMEFLREMGFHYRLSLLLSTCKSDRDRESLLKSANLIVGGDEQNGMGSAFKAFSLFPSTLRNIMRKRNGPVGFSSVVSDCLK